MLKVRGFVAKIFNTFCGLISKTKVFVFFFCISLLLMFKTLDWFLFSLTKKFVKFGKNQQILLVKKEILLKFKLKSPFVFNVENYKYFIHEYLLPNE